MNNIKKIVTLLTFNKNNNIKRLREAYLKKMQEAFIIYTKNKHISEKSDSIY